jgi:phosphotransferase system enzyme I (PtsI)
LAALDEQIADYNSASDEYLQARSSDLADLRDRVLRILRGGQRPAPKIPGGAVICADDLPPSRFLEIDWSAGGGLALLRGSPTSHVAMLARARGIPMVVQLGALPDAATALLDGESATLELDPGADQITLFERRREAHRKSRASARAILRRPAATWRGERIRLLINIQRVDDLEHADAQYADGIGLMRTEFLLSGPGGMPDEDTQYRAYDAVLRWADKKPVTIRTFDAGGDKPGAGFTPDGEANPFLGLRGLRLCLARPDLFKVQLRALARAAVRGNLKVMFPMVTVPAELEAARALFMEVVADLQAEGIGAMLPELGIMVEVPAVAMAIGDFKASFFSIGSNDLAQYVLACDRSNGALATLMDPLHPAVLELIARTGGHRRQPVRRHGGRPTLRATAIVLRPARALGECALAGADQADHRPVEPRRERWLTRRSTRTAMRARLQPTSASSRMCWTAVPPACASAWRMPWARTAASSARFPIRPIRCRSRCSTSPPFSTSAIFRRRPSRSSCAPMRVPIRAASGGSARAHMSEC